MDKDLIYTGEDLKNNWFYNRYYYSGSNSRYLTFQMALNLLNQRHPCPTIVETGCQRQEEDLGGGMSTSIFAEYISRYGGSLISIDISLSNLSLCRNIISNKWPSIKATMVCQDSVAYLKGYTGSCDLLYLDSFDYPYGQLLDMYGGQKDINNAIQTLSVLPRDEIINRHSEVISPCQKHCLEEFRAIEERLPKDCILLIDDNQLAGGGKPRLLKEYLPTKGWVCLVDFQCSMWVKEV